MSTPTPKFPDLSSDPLFPAGSAAVYDTPVTVPAARYAYTAEDPGNRGQVYGEALCVVCGYWSNLTLRGDLFVCRSGCPGPPELIAEYAR